MPIKRLKTTTMKKNKKTKTKKQTSKINKSNRIQSNMDSMYNNNNNYNNNSSNSNSNSNSNLLFSNIQMQNHTTNQQNLINLITKISQERKHKTKSQTNLVAKIMRLPSMDSRMSKPKTYAKTESSYYSTMTHNGESHNKGKKIVNESTKPYLEIDEMQDDQVQHYMLPKNSIPYREPIQEDIPIQEQKIILEYYPYSNQTKKTKTSKKTKKTKTSKTSKTTKKNKKSKTTKKK